MARFDEENIGVAKKRGPLVFLLDLTLRSAITKAMKILLSLVLSLFASFAWAGDEIYNGGDVLECPGPMGPNRVVLDVFEAQEVYGLRVRLPQSLDYVGQAREMIERFTQHSPRRARLYSQWLETFMSEVQFVDNIDFKNVADEGLVVGLPKGCELKQAAVQVKNPPYPFGRRYYIDRPLWDSLDSFNKAALITHEIIYREVIEQDFPRKDSVRVRYVNAVMMSEQVLEMQLRDFLLMLQSSGFQLGEAHGYMLQLNSAQARNLPVYFHDEKTVRSASLSSEGDYPFSQGRVSYSCDLATLTDGNRPSIQFYPTSVAQKIKVPCALALLRFKTRAFTGSAYLNEAFVNWDNSLNEIYSFSLGQKQVSTIEGNPGRILVTQHLGWGMTFDSAQGGEIENLTLSTVAEDRSRSMVRVKNREGLAQASTLKAMKLRYLSKEEVFQVLE